MSIKRSTDIQDLNNDRKRLKNDNSISHLPTGFFDNEKEELADIKKNEHEGDDLDDDWANFQREINMSSTIGSANASVISSLMNSDDHNGAVIESEAVYNSQAKTATIESKSAIIEEKVDEDNGEDEQEKLLEEFEEQEKLHQRVERIKLLREQKRKDKQIDSSIPDKQIGSNVVDSSLDNNNDEDHGIEDGDNDDEYNNEDDDDLWRRRKV